MTKYILHGGATGRPSVNNDNFFKEMVRSLSAPIKILLVYFAIPKKKWEELREDDRKNFSSAEPVKKLELVIASDEIDIFTNQIAASSLIYIRGGDEGFIYDFFSKVKNLKDLFSDKVVGGSSAAGAYVLSRYYYSDTEDKVEEGTGAVPVKVTAHYSEKSKALEKLKMYGENLKTYLLRDTEYIVIEK